MDEILILNLVGTFAFGLSGGIVAVRKKMDLFGVLVLSVATGLGGGALRDILAAEVPLVLRSEIYAVASLLGAIIIVLANQAQILGPPEEILAAVATFALRMVSVRRGWKIPIAHPGTR